MQEKLLLSIIKQTVKGKAEINKIAEDARIPVIVVKQSLESLSERGLLDFKNESVEVSSSQRILMAVEAIKNGASLDKACRFLGWNEFEDLATLALEANQFITKKHVRFKSANQRWEIDIIGLRKPIVLSIDCKHWKRSWQRSATMKAVESQIQRTEALSQVLPSLKGKLRIDDWREAKILPLILTLSESPFRIYKGSPVVPILKLKSFLYELPAYIDSLTTFKETL